MMLPETLMMAASGHSLSEVPVLQKPFPGPLNSLQVVYSPHGADLPRVIQEAHVAFRGRVELVDLDVAKPVDKFSPHISSQAVA